MKSLNLIWFSIMIVVAAVSCKSAVLPVDQKGTETTHPSTTALPDSSLSPPVPADALPIEAATGIPQVVAETEVPTPASIPFEFSTPQPPANEQNTHRERTYYHMRLQLDYWNHSAYVEETVRYVHNSLEPVNSLVMLVDSNRYLNVFYLRSITWETGEIASGYKLVKDQLSIPLQSPLTNQQVATFTLTYDLVLPEIPPPSDTHRPESFGFTARQLNLVDWYPYFPPYKTGEGWVLNKPYVFGEHQIYETADFTVELELINPPANLEVAASSQFEYSGGVFTYQHTKARNFALSASNMYQVFHQTVGEVEVFSYAFPFDSEGGKAALRDTADALALYSELFGPYPHSTLSVVEADFLDGMEYDGLYFLSRGFYSLYDGTPRGYLTAIAVHETAHQWWYGLVANDQAHEPWLDEALCTYSERLFYEHRYPDLVDWWWSFRVNYYQPTGWIDSQIYDYEGFRPYRDSVYLRGAMFFEDLRLKMGDEAFFAFLKSYVLSLSHQIASSDDFISLLKEFTQADLSSVLEKYIQYPDQWK